MTDDLPQFVRRNGGGMPPPAPPAMQQKPEPFLDSQRREAEFRRQPRATMPPPLPNSYEEETHQDELEHEPQPKKTKNEKVLEDIKNALGLPPEANGRDVLQVINSLKQAHQKSTLTIKHLVASLGLIT